jgi:hypothetical protein
MRRVVPRGQSVERGVLTWQLLKSFPRSEATVKQQDLADLKEALYNTLHRLIWQYGCLSCNAKKLTHSGAGLLWKQILCDYSFSIFNHSGGRS